MKTPNLKTTAKRKMKMSKKAILLCATGVFLSLSNVYAKKGGMNGFSDDDQGKITHTLSSAEALIRAKMDAGNRIIIALQHLTQEERNSLVDLIHIAINREFNISKQSESFKKIGKGNEEDK